MSNEINPSRSAIVTRQSCTRERFYGYDYVLPGATVPGMSKKGAKYEADFGTLVHSALAVCVAAGRYVEPQREKRLLTDLIEERFKGSFIDHLTHTKMEQQWLLDTLIYAWCKQHLAKLLRDYDILSVEVETSVLFKASDYLPESIAQLQRDFRLPLRLDVLLRQKDSRALFILDFKTASTASEDWEANLNNSLQSDLYVEGVSQLYPDDFVGGIFYMGLVKGKRQMDTARSSPYNGYIIQYGSFLYGWEGKNGVQKDYVNGTKRVFLPTALNCTDAESFYNAASAAGWNFSSYIPSTIPWKPLGTGMTVGQVIVNENGHADAVDLYMSAPLNSPERLLYENVLFEQTKSNCLKYGNKHACQFNEVCNGKAEEWEVLRIYEPRVDHHALD